MSGLPPHRYILFGLRVASEIHLPEALGDRDSDPEPEVIIRLGTLGGGRTPPGMSYDGTTAMLTVPGVARYRISKGSEIEIDVVSGAPDKNVRLYLLGSAMGAALHQRGLLPLHATSVEIDGRAIAFVGQSGAGKSTLAAWFNDLGYRVLSDDVCVVHGVDGDRPEVYPAVRHIRLCRDALIASGRTADQFEASYSGDPTFDKFDVPLQQGDASPARLSAVVLLEFGSVKALQHIEGVDAAASLFAHTYRGEMVDDLGGAELHWRAVMGLMRAIQIFRWTRPRDPLAIGDSTADLLGTLADQLTT